jgi:hypothetical protein
VIVAGYPHALLAATKTIPLIGKSEDMAAEGAAQFATRLGGSGRQPMMHGCEKSDSAIVAVKPANKAERSQHPA